MKTRKLLSIAALLLFFSSCVVFSFYPIYTPDDLFPNDYLLGNFITEDSASWKFDFHYKGKEGKETTDSLRYLLDINDGGQQCVEASFQVHLIRIGKQLIADFYLDDYQHGSDDDITMFDLHIIPVHTFAKVDLMGDSIHFTWIDPEWLEKQLEDGKVRIHHENNKENILLTAKPKELQKFVKKYLNSEEAFDEGMDFMIYRKND